MKRLLIFFIITSFLFNNCLLNNKNIIDISDHYKKYNDLKSLKKLVKFIKLGMSKEEVEKILGDPTYSPVEGQYYYSSDTISLLNHCTIGAVLEYRKFIYYENDIIVIQTGKLEDVYVGEICE